MDVRKLGGPDHFKSLEYELRSFLEGKSLDRGLPLEVAKMRRTPPGQAAVPATLVASKPFIDSSQGLDLYLDGADNAPSR
jgi:hypothetical protein